MKIVLEVHAYAPELNRAYIGPNRTMIRTPGCACIAAVRRAYFAPLRHAGRYARLQAHNTRALAHCDRTMQGYYAGPEMLRSAIDQFRRYHNLPGCTFTFKTMLVG